jgi:HSP20 family protein
MNRLFDTVFAPSGGTRGRLRAGYVYPPMNVTETDESYVVECEVPGLEMDELEVTVTGDHLAVSGRRPNAVPEDGVCLHRRERDAGAFNRGVALPRKADGTRAEASLRNGILTIRIPKAEESKPKRIEISAES